METIDDKHGQFVNFMFKHFLSMGWHVQPIDAKGNATGPSTGLVTSGSLFEYKGLYCILTAGHVLKYVQKEFLESGKYAVHGCCLIDCFGDKVMNRHPIPFVYDDAPKWFVDDEEDGLDFGFVGLSDYYLALLDKNGLVAVREDNWRKQGDIEMEWFLMTGLPSCYTEVSTVVDAGISYTDYKASPTMILLEKAEAPEGSAQTSYQRFVGKIDNKVTLEDIDGMSGGPIFGFARRDGQLHYWPVAVQSGWLKSKRITFGCPIPTIGRLLDKWIGEMPEFQGA